MSCSRSGINQGNAGAMIDLAALPKNGAIIGEIAGQVD